MEPYCNLEENAMTVAITVKNIPQPLYEKLKLRAGRNRRSVNGEIISIFEEALTVHTVKPEDILASARALREKTRKFTLDQEFIDRAKSEGRP
jgi:plasmid stability protein